MKKKIELLIAINKLRVKENKKKLKKYLNGKKLNHALAIELQTEIKSLKIHIKELKKL